MIPAKFLLAPGDLPTTGTGKLDRRTLSEWMVPEGDVEEDDEAVKGVWEMVCPCSVPWYVTPDRVLGM